MKNAPRSLVALTAFVLLAGCDDAPTQPQLASANPPAFNASENPPAERYVEEHIYDFDGSSTYIECEDGSASEMIQLEGQLYVRNVLIGNPAGGYTYTMNTMPIGMRGIGLTTGEEYRVSERQHFTATQTTMNAAGSYRAEQTFMGKDSKARFRMVSQGHYAVNANGELVVQKDNIEYICAS